MSPSLTRLILAVVFIASLVFVWFVIFIIISETIHGTNELNMTASLVTTAFYLVFGWIILWRGAVRWEPWRRAATVVSVLACILPALIPGLAVGWAMGRNFFIEGATFTTIIAWALLWLASTALIWRETKTERIARLKMLGINAVVCPNCGYNLTGMTSTTCPECGSQYTLDQLYATLTKTDEQMEQV